METFERWRAKRTRSASDSHAASRLLTEEQLWTLWLLEVHVPGRAGPRISLEERFGNVAAYGLSEAGKLKFIKEFLLQCAPFTRDGYLRDTRSLFYGLIERFPGDVPYQVYHVGLLLKKLCTRPAERQKLLVKTFAEKA
jgi:hypothetical protein